MAFVRVGFIVLGIMFAVVRVIPVNFSLFWHNMVTYMAVGAFAIMLIAVPFLFRRLTGGFFGVTVVVAGMLATAAWGVQLLPLPIQTRGPMVCRARNGVLWKAA